MACCRRIRKFGRELQATSAMHSGKLKSCNYCVTRKELNVLAIVKCVKHFYCYIYIEVYRLTMVPLFAYELQELQEGQLVRWLQVFWNRTSTGAKHSNADALSCRTYKWGLWILWRNSIQEKCDAVRWPRNASKN